MRLRRCLGFVAVLGFMAATTQIVYAQQTYAGDSSAELMGRLNAQEQRIAELESQLTERQQPFQMQPASWSYDSMARRLEVLEAAVAYGDDGKDGGKGWVDSHNQKWATTWGGRMFFDYANFVNQNADSVTVLGNAQDYAEFRSIRLFAEGSGYGVFGYKLEMDFAPELGTFDDPAVRVEDAYIGIKDVPLAGTVVMGNQKVPFGLDALTRHEHTMFMERAKPVERAVPYNVFNVLGPTDGDVALRRVGIAVYNHSDCPRWAYQGGIFFEDIDPLEKQRISDQQGFEFAMRGVWLPMYANDGRQLVHLGAGLDYVNDADDIVYFGYRPEVHEGPITSASGVFIGPNEYTRVNLEAAMVMGPASVQTELFATRVNNPGLDYYGAYVQGSFFLTGENRGYDPQLGVFDRVTPLENFWIVNTPDGRCCGTGAWEAAIRWSWVDVSDGGGGFPFPGPSNLAGTENNITLGMNWYWNPHARMMFNYIHAYDSYVAGPAAKPELDILAVRWQVDF
jgi:phosphate-selective porin OprO/OprP